MTRRGLGRRGATAVEFALTLPLLLLLIFGAIEFGRLFWTRGALQHVAVAAARCMGVKQAACATSGVVSTSRTAALVRTNAAGFSVALAPSAIVASASGTCAGQAGFATVSIATSFVTVVPVLRQFLGTSLPVNVVACFPNQP